MRWLAVAIFVGAVCAEALGDPAVTVHLDSSVAGQAVGPGAAIDWTITFLVSNGDNAGLAVISADLIQDAANPSFVEIAPAAGVPSGMAGFSRPAGVSNPGEGGATTGFVGVQRSPKGELYKNLVQIGGGQNALGIVGPPGVGQDITVDAGVGQGGEPQLLATGTFTAATIAGSYTYRIENLRANVLTTTSTPPVPPAPWPTSRATVDASGAAFTITVVTIIRGDLNCDGVVNVDDVPHFAQALVEPDGYESAHPGCEIVRADMNDSGAANAADISLFVSALLD